MKTALQIQRNFPGTKTRTQGKPNVHVCTVTFPNGETVQGIGSTLHTAEDTAWYAVKITLCDKSRSL